MNYKKFRAILLGTCIFCIGGAVPVSAAEFTSSSSQMTEKEAEELFSDGTSDGNMNELVENIVEITTAKAEEYMEEVQAAKEAAIEKEEQRKAEEARKKAEEARKKAEEARKKAEEEAKKKAEEEARKAEEERMAKRQEIVDFALQFEGNPYVYGGTSLTNGADCSGFVMSVFKEFGYELPRVAAAQMEASELKDVEDIEIGDLVFYGDYGIDHVALYIGDGKIIHASTSATGIKISDYNYRQPAAVGTYLE
mgnify:CR=1 FL=1